MKNKMHLINIISQILTIDLIKKSNVEFGETTQIYNSFGFSVESEQFIGFFTNIFLCQNNVEFFDNLYKKGIFEKNDIFYYYSELENKFFEVKKVFNGEICEYFLIDNEDDYLISFNGNENEFQQKYNLNENIVKNAELILNEVSDFIRDEKNVFKFRYNGVNYTVPIYAVILKDIFDSILKGEYREEMFKELDMSKDDIKEIILNIENVHFLINLSIEKEEINKYSWKETLIF